MTHKTENIIRFSLLAAGMFSVAVLANYTAEKMVSEDPIHRKQGLFAAVGGVVVSVLILAHLNGVNKEILGKKIVTSPI